MHTRVHAVIIRGIIKRDVDISSPPMLAIFTEDLLVHTNLLPLFVCCTRVLQIEGEVTGNSVLVTSGSGSGLGPSGDQIGQERGGVT